MTICIHCKRLDEEHISLKCLFSSTAFSPIQCEECKKELHVGPTRPTTADLHLRLIMYLDGDGKYRHKSCARRFHRKGGEVG
jgi:hypothetical protein